MSDKPSILNSIKTVLEIVAIPVAAWWAYSRFKQVDQPDLLPRFNVQTSLTWNEGTKGRCLGTFDVQLENTGKKTITIDSLRVTAWLAPSLQSDAQLVGLEPARLTNSSPIADSVYTDRLTGIYEPTNGSSDAFVYAAKRLSQQFALFRVVVWGRIEGVSDTKPPWTDYRWDWVCGSPNNTSGSSTSPPVQ